MPYVPGSSPGAPTIYIIIMNKLILLLSAVLMCSCSVTQPVWEGTKEVVGTGVGTGEDLVVSIWSGGKDVVGAGVNAVEGVVEGAYGLVTNPFTSDGGATRERRMQHATTDEERAEMRERRAERRRSSDTSEDS